MGGGEVTLSHYQTCTCKLKALLSLTEINVHVMKARKIDM